MKKKIIIFVSTLVLLSIGTSFLNIVGSESTPTSPHEGDAYVGEFWLEVIESPPPLVDDIVIGHAKATHDWIIYDSDSNVVADYYINNSIANIPDINISFYLLVDLVINDTETVEVGMDYYRINNSQLINYYPDDVKGKLSVSLSNLSFDGENATLLCTLEAVVGNGLNDKNKPKLISFAQDECIVAIEKYSNNNGNFSYYLDQAEGNSTSMWSWILDRNVTGDQSLTICAVAPLQEAPLMQGDNTSGYWYLGKVYFSIENLHAEILDWEDGDLEYTHEVYGNESMIDIPAGISWEYYSGPLSLPVWIGWNLKGAGGIKGAGRYLLFPDINRSIPLKNKIGAPFPEYMNESTLTLDGEVTVSPIFSLIFSGLGGDSQDIPDAPYYTLHLKRVNSSNNSNPNPNPSPNWIWIGGFIPK